MNQPPQTQKHFQSARQRFLEPSIESFLERELTSHFGPVVRQAISRELARLVEEQLPPREFLRPGQCVWLAVSKDTRPNSPRRRLVPVVLTLIDQDDVTDLAQGQKMSEIARRSVARLTREAYEHRPDLEFVCQTTGLSPQLVQQYVQLIQLDQENP